MIQAIWELKTSDVLVNVEFELLSFPINTLFFNNTYSHNSLRISMVLTCLYNVDR